MSVLRFLHVARLMSNLTIAILYSYSNICFQISFMLDHDGLQLVTIIVNSHSDSDYFHILVTNCLFLLFSPSFRFFSTWIEMLLYNKSLFHTFERIQQRFLSKTVDYKLNGAKLADSIIFGRIIRTFIFTRHIFRL